MAVNYHVWAAAGQVLAASIARGGSRRHRVRTPSLRWVEASPSTEHLFDRSRHAQRAVVPTARALVNGGHVPLSVVFEP
jgi:hypothetical protein